MGDLLGHVDGHPDAEIVGICHDNEGEMAWSRDKYSISDERVFTDFVRCMEESKPDVVVLCPKVADHLLWVERIASYGVHILMEKPFAVNLAEAEKMRALMAGTGKALIVNWPMVWMPTNVKCHELIVAGKIGEVREVHYYDGNEGPLCHGAHKEGREPTLADKQESWFYSKAAGGGSLLDYLGYGVTLGSWFMDGQKPLSVFSQRHIAEGLEVDEQSVTVVRYKDGLSKFETKWGMFSSPWIDQPGPRCGFVVVGSGGSVSSFDYDGFVTLRDKDCPSGKKIKVDVLEGSRANPIAYLIDCLERGVEIEGPLSVEISLMGQGIVDAAVLSCEEGRVVEMG